MKVIRSEMNTSSIVANPVAVGGVTNSNPPDSRSRRQDSQLTLKVSHPLSSLLTLGAFNSVLHLLVHHLLQLCARSWTNTPLQSGLAFPQLWQVATPFPFLPAVFPACFPPLPFLSPSLDQMPFTFCCFPLSLPFLPPFFSPSFDQTMSTSMGPPLSSVSAIGLTESCNPPSVIHLWLTCS